VVDSDARVNRTQVLRPQASLPASPILKHSPRMKLLIVDDHPVLREGLAALLRQAGPETDVLLASDAGEGLALVELHVDLDAVVLDLMMPGMDGWRAITEFGRKRPELPVIVLSSSEDPQDARKALALGALGYVPKSASQHVLLQAIRIVLNGDLYVPPLVLRRGGSPERPRGAECCATDDAADRNPHDAQQGSAEQDDCSDARPLGEDGQGAYHRDLPGAERRQPHPGRVRRPRRRADLKRVHLGQPYLTELASDSGALSPSSAAAVRLEIAARSLALETGLCSSKRALA